MSDLELEEVYRNKAEKYEQMVSREDYQHNIEAAIQNICDPHGLDVIDTGSGTGRLAVMLGPQVKSVRAYDISQSMLDIAAARLQAAGLRNWQAEVADHRALPASDQSADLIVSGWSVVYTVVWCPENWREELGKALTEMKRVLRPGGTLLILETMGTGFESPQPPDDLKEYFQYLDQAGFSSTWIRTDYQFASMEEAKDLTAFFFGEEMIEKVISTDPVILPECTGLWWMRLPE